MHHPLRRKLLLHPPAPRIGEPFPIFRDCPPRATKHLAPGRHGRSHDQAEGISSVAHMVPEHRSTYHRPQEVQCGAAVATQSTEVHGL